LKSPITSFKTILIIGLSDQYDVVCDFSDTSPPLMCDFLSDLNVTFYLSGTWVAFANSKDRI